MQCSSIIIVRNYFHFVSESCFVHRHDITGPYYQTILHKIYIAAYILSFECYWSKCDFSHKFCLFFSLRYTFSDRNRSITSNLISRWPGLLAATWWVFCCRTHTMCDVWNVCKDHCVLFVHHSSKSRESVSIFKPPVDDDNRYTWYFATFGSHLVFIHPSVLYSRLFLTVSLFVVGKQKINRASRKFHWVSCHYHIFYSSNQY